jgi:hypothetical protein
MSLYTSFAVAGAGPTIGGRIVKVGFNTIDWYSFNLSDLFDRLWLSGAHQ